MPPKEVSHGSLANGNLAAGQKRKAPCKPSGTDHGSKRSKSSHGPPTIKPAGNRPSHPGSKPGTSRSRRQIAQRDARTLATQSTSKAFRAGALDVDKFVKARAFEIAALEDGLRRSKKGRAQRAFQGVPRDMRRRAGAWEVRKLPGRVRDRARREIREDNTPTGAERARKISRRMRVRLETVKKLRALGVRERQRKNKDRAAVKNGLDKGAGKAIPAQQAKQRPAKGTKKTGVLRDPPVPKARFRKRQMHKTWLPTHMFHAKRAHMSSPLEPMWRFAMPMSPTAKVYRPTHRAASERGCVAWDTSYIATIGLEGREAGIDGLLRGMGFVGPGKAGLAMWKMGRRACSGWVHKRDRTEEVLAPVTVVWCAANEGDVQGQGKPGNRRALIRVHPSAFHDVWEQVIRLCAVQKPHLSAEDLRFEIGSIEVHGPGATEALQSALSPSDEDDVSGKAWRSFNGLANPAALPLGTTLAFTISDPRLRHPPRTVTQPPDMSHLIGNISKLIAQEATSSPQAIFDAQARRTATAALQTQKSINRRSALAGPGKYATPVAGDARIPILLQTQPAFCSHSSSANTSATASWSVLIPWKAVQPVWQNMMYYPLSTTGQPRFGGLDEQRQLAFEKGLPWFPGDFPGTAAGDAWQKRERDKRKTAWDRKPPSRRIAFNKIALAPDRKGEIGDSWGLDFDLLVNVPSTTSSGDGSAVLAAQSNVDTRRIEQCIWRYLPSALAAQLIKQPDVALSPAHEGSLITVRISYIGKGSPSPTARVYSLPTKIDNARHWNNLLPPQCFAATDPQRELARLARSRPKNRIASVRQDMPNKGKSGKADIRLLARELLAGDNIKSFAGECQTGNDEAAPCVPGVEDLLGFVTTGAFNLAHGKGSGVASLGLARVMKALAHHGRLGKVCIVRNTGESLGRLAVWEII